MMAMIDGGGSKVHVVVTVGCGTMETLRPLSFGGGFQSRQPPARRSDEGGRRQRPNFQLSTFPSYLSTYEDSYVSFHLKARY